MQMFSYKNIVKISEPDGFPLFKVDGSFEKAYQFLKLKSERLERELTTSKLENDKLVFELRLAKTRIAVFEERLAKIEVGERPVKRPIKVTVENNNYGCFGFNLGGTIKVKFDDEPIQLKKISRKMRSAEISPRQSVSDDSCNISDTDHNYRSCNK